jgi:hypothetical protein
MESIEACPMYQPYGYNGKEKLLSDVHDYGAGIYITSIGRWTRLDPLASYNASTSQHLNASTSQLAVPGCYRLTNSPNPD